MTITIALDKQPEAPARLYGLDKPATKKLAQAATRLEINNRMLAGYNEGLRESESTIERISAALPELEQLHSVAHRAAVTLIAQTQKLRASKRGLEASIAGHKTKLQSNTGAVSETARKAVEVALTEALASEEEIDAVETALRQERLHHAQLQGQLEKLSDGLADKAVGIVGRNLPQVLRHPLAGHVTRYLERTSLSTKAQRTELTQQSEMSARSVTTLETCVTILRDKKTLKQTNGQIIANKATLPNLIVDEKLKREKFERAQAKKITAQQAQSRAKQSIQRLNEENGLAQDILGNEELKIKAFLEDQMHNTDWISQAVEKAYNTFTAFAKLCAHWGIDSSGIRKKYNRLEHQDFLEHDQLFAAPFLIGFCTKPFDRRISSTFFRYVDLSQRVTVRDTAIQLDGKMDDEAILVALEYALTVQGDKPISITSDRQQAVRIMALAEHHGFGNYEITMPRYKISREVWRGSSFAVAKGEVANKHISRSYWHGKRYARIAAELRGEFPAVLARISPAPNLPVFDGSADADPRQLAA